MIVDGEGSELNTDLENDAPLATEADAPAEFESASIDDAISAAFDEHEGGADRVRDPATGRFVQKDAATPAPEGQQQAKDASQAVDQQPASPQATNDAAPASWGRNGASVWQGLTPEAKAFLAQREEQISRGFARYEGVAEYADLAERNGGNLKSVLSTVKQLEDLMAADPVRGLATIAQRAGADPVKVAEAIISGWSMREQQPQQSAIPPQLAQELSVLREQVQELRFAPTRAEIEKFASDPANKYFVQVADNMAMLLEREKNLTIKDAYERAIWSDPQIRTELLNDLQAQSQQVNQRAVSTQAAQRASRGLRPSNVQPLNGAAGKAMSIEESINDAFARHS